MFRHLGGKWKFKLLCTLHYNKRAFLFSCFTGLRYSDMKRMVTGISPTMLASSLRELEESGLVSRTIHDTMPVRVDYSITEAGESLVPILDEFRDWMVAYEPHLYYKR